ncbi:hypothetical protein QUF80_04740 [Desulfococcaceae bacterium HSG8]|nr:hypothetical protein [Desulfococcaceae bacterium HSG8]
MKGILILAVIVIFISVGTAAAAGDSDGDGMPDWWEKRFPGNESQNLDFQKDDSREDPDEDNLVNIEEFSYGTHPFYKDTDEDGLDDGEEVHQYRTNPAMADTDGGGRADGHEVSGGSDPLNPDDDDSSVITVSISLKEKWNLISIPVLPASSSISELLAPISGSYSVIWSYQGGKWKMYTPSNPGFSDLKTIETGRGYWIKMNYSETLTVSGSAAPGAISLEKSWNLVGYNSPNSQPVHKALSSIEGKYASVWVFTDGAWKAYDPSEPGFSNLATIESGYGYWIDAKNNCTWTLP